MRLIELAGRADRQRLLEKTYEAVLTPSFRSDELDPLEVTAAGLDEEPRTKDVVVALDDNAAVAGVAIGDWDPESGIYLLSYLAARPGARGQGMGTELMEHVASWWHRRGALLGLAEVDDPRRYRVTEMGDPVERLRFYARFGGRLLDVAHLQPRLRLGGARVRGMLLLAFDVRAAALATAEPPTLRAEVLLTFLRGYFEDAEGPGGEDAERADYLEAVEARTKITLLPAEAYEAIPPLR